MRSLDNETHDRAFEAWRNRSLQFQMNRRATEAMGCEVVCAIRPKQRTSTDKPRTFAGLIWDLSAEVAGGKRLVWNSCTDQQRWRNWVDCVKVEMRKPEVRRSNQWTERLSEKLKEKEWTP